MLCETKTIKGGTMTSEGLIPHIEVMGLLLPVMLDIHNTGVGKVMAYQKPLRSADGALVYAMPGKGMYITAAA